MENQQQKISQKSLKKNKTSIEAINKQFKSDKLYVEYKTFRQEAAGLLNKFSKHFSNEKNVKAMKSNICAILDDLSSHANTINKAKSSGLGFGIANILFPNTIKAINEKNNEKDSSET